MRSGPHRGNRARQGVLLSVALTASQAYGQGPNGVLEEVLVNAQKREQTLSEVPISLAILDSELLESARVDDFTNVSQFVANFSFYQGFDRSEVAVNIRGLTSGTSNPGIDPSVGFFVDGVYIARPAALTGKLLAVDGIEVLRGPQGTLYGRNTSAGAVNIYTRDPGEELEGEIQVGYGNFDEFTVAGSVSGPLSSNGSGFLLSAFRTEGDTYLDNAATGDALGEREDTGFFGKLLFTPNDELSVQLTMDYSENTTTAANLVGPFQKDQGDIRAIIGAAQMQMNPALAQNIRFVQDVPVDTFDRVVGRSDEPQADDLEQFGVALEVNYEFGGGTLTSITAFRDSEDFAAVDPDLSPADLFLTSVRNDDEQFSQEIRFASRSETRFNYLLGLYYFDSQFTADTQTSFGVPLFAQYNAAMPPNPITEPQRANSVASQDIEALALFGQLTFDLTDSLTLTYGFRFNDEEKSSVINQNPDPGVNSSSGIPFPLQFPVLLDLEAGVSDEDFISTLSLNWEFGEASSLYFSFAEGLKSGGINANILLNTNSLTFDQETSTNYEIGYRTTLDNGLRFSSALFFTDFEDLQIATFDPSNPANIIVTNAGAAEIFGVEADIYWKVNESFELNASFAYNDSEYQDTVFPGFQLGENPALPGITLQLPGLRDADGRTLSRAPEITASIGGQFNFDLSDRLRASIRADFSYMDSQFLDPILSPQSEIDAYSIVSLRAQVRTVDEKWTLTLYGDNVFDEDYFSQIIASPGAAALGVNPQVATWIGAQGLPAVYGVELTRKF